MKPLASSTALKRVFFLSAVAASSLFGGSHAFGQINGVGISDPNLFDNVINVPSDRNFGDDQSVGDDGQTTQINVSDDALLGPGRIGSRFDADTGVEFNITGGIIGDNFSAGVGSEINISGGVIGRNFGLSGDQISGSISGGTFDSARFGTANAVDRGNQVSISGGSFGRDFSSGGNVEFVGGEFRLNGSEFLGDRITLSEGDVFTGTFADGSAFVFDGNDIAFDSNSSDRLTNTVLTRTALPAISTTPQIVDTASTQGSSLRDGQTLTLRDGGELVNFEAVNATFNLEGGTLRSSFGSQGAGSFVGGVSNISGGDASSNLRTFQGNELNLSGGSIGRFFGSRDSTVNITGGSIASNANFFGSTVNLDGGSIGSSSDFFDSEVSITGGEVDSGLNATDSNVNITGGVFGDFIGFGSGSVVNIEGGTFGFLSGAASGSDVTISGGNFGTGFSADDGSDVTISGGVFGDSVDFFNPGTVELIGGEFALNGAAFTDSTISLGEGDTFTGVFQDGSAFIFSDNLFDRLEGVTLTTSSITAPVSNEFTVDTASPAGAPLSLRNGQTLTVLEGGSLDNTFESVGGSINVAGGSLEDVSASGGTITLNDGFVEDVNLVDGGLLEVNGGGISNITIFSSQVDFTGGSTQTVNQFFTASDESTVNVSGGTIEGPFQVSDTEVNIFDDADVASLIATGSEVNVSGGRLDIADVRDLSTINISGGEIGILRVIRGSQFNITGGSALSSNGFLGSESSTGNLSGGRIGNDFDVSFGAALQITGGQIGNDLTIDTNSTLDISGGQIGNRLVLSNSVGNISGGTIGNDFTLERDAVVNVSGGEIGNRFAVGSVAPGTPQFIAEGTVNVSGGQIGNDFTVGDHGIANISGGTFGSRFSAFDGSVVNITGGVVGDGFDAGDGSEVNISGGRLGQEFDAQFGSLVRINGGTFGRGFSVRQESDTEFSGGEFQLNGQAFTGSTISLGDGDVFTGTFEDGSVFVFADESNDRLSDVRLNQTAIQSADLTPVFVSSAMQDALGLRAGQTLTLEQGGVIIGEFEAAGGVINVNGGIFADDTAFANTIVNLNDGSLSDALALAGTEFNLLGGTVDSLFAGLGSEINIHGGIFENRLTAVDASTIDVFATEFLINGDEVDFIDSDTPLLIENRNFTLSGTFLDGSEFEYVVRSSFGGDFLVSSDANFQLNLVTASAVPEPSALYLLALSSMMLLGKRRRA